jgi:hypothetical protein
VNRAGGVPGAASDGQSGVPLVPLHSFVLHSTQLAFPRAPGHGRKTFRTHPWLSAGMPYPQNLQTALEVEAVIRAGGAVPATIAVINGQPCIGRAQGS